MEPHHGTRPEKGDFLRAMAIWVAGLAVCLIVGYIIRGRIFSNYFSMLSAVGYIASVVLLLWISVRGMIALKGTRYRYFYLASATVFVFFLWVILAEVRA